MRVQELRRDGLMRLWCRYTHADGTDEWRIRDQARLLAGELGETLGRVVPHVSASIRHVPRRANGEGSTT